MSRSSPFTPRTPMWVRATKPLPLVGRRARRWQREFVLAWGGGWNPWDDGWDDGSAGVREPRRPRPTLPALAVALDEPD